MREPTDNPTRAQARDCWESLTAGTITPAEASAWAQSYLDAALPGDEELVIQALLFLQAAGYDHHLVSPRQIRDGLDAWLTELERYDRDPNSWMTKYYAGMIVDYAQRHGDAAARRFAAKLPRHPGA